MASACTFHGVIGIEHAEPYVLESKKRFWKMDGFVPISTDPEDSAGDLPASVFIFGGNNPPPEDGIYFVNARIVTTVNQDDTSLELYCVDDMQSTDISKFLPTVIVVGKVTKGSSELKDKRAFDVDITQYGIMPQQIARIRCFYPDNHPRLTKTPVPTAEKHVVVQGSIIKLTHNRCVIRVHDITLGPSTGVVEKQYDVEKTPPVKLKSFNWSSGKDKKSKRAKHADSDESDLSPSKGKKKAVDNVASSSSTA
ncbi:hypothetical protein CY34DRAFT_100593 [Suillus luteus UH-Slu-Lm8-n1]|uniref:Uncharacterized protein n=1 Tax=Suillus luteus UH-Slu-Lm8-n1 TaxID=930992 RepID=A0A0D0A3T0_9AGAM|nr:hypothetical protein CY34DRAFT_100593 [Suillus luteus UH-Slu-Lm8-n1]